MSRCEHSARTERETREDTAAFLASWRARGGFDGAVARLSDPLRPEWQRAYGRATATTDHMPFKGHRHMGEIV